MPGTDDGQKAAGEATPASIVLTGHGYNPAHGLRARTDGLFILSQTDPERRWILQTRSCRLAVEAMEDRSVLSTAAYGDFNNDGLVDTAAVSQPFA